MIISIFAGETKDSPPGCAALDGMRKDAVRKGLSREGVVRVAVLAQAPEGRRVKVGVGAALLPWVALLSASGREMSGS